MTTLWNKRNTLIFTTTLSGYLYTAVRNSIFNLLARKKLSREYTESIKAMSLQTDLATDHLVRLNQLAAVIEQEIASLPPRTKEIFELSRKGFMSHKEIAEHLQISEQTVKTTVNNALKVLRVKLGSMLTVIV